MKQQKIKLFKLKITCYTPPGKAKGCSKNFGMKYFGSLEKPIETKVISDTEFYYIYEYEKESQMQKIIDKKLPKAEQTIRTFYLTIIGITKRANHLGKKGAWTVDKIRRWIVRRFVKKGGEAKQIEDFVDAINLEDEEFMMKFLSKPLFKHEVLK